MTSQESDEHGVWSSGLKRHAQELLESEVSPPPVKKRVARQLDEPKARPEHDPPPCDRILPSPFRLTHIEDLPRSMNEDTVTLGGLLGDPLIRECWIFDYLFDMDFLMKHFDADVRGIVDVKVIHGSWRREDLNNAGINEAVARYPNVEAITAYMPEAYGTHHSKMMILFRHDDTAEIIIHTANMIARDWKNMTQAVWQSPRLPRLAEGSKSGRTQGSLGSGIRFKVDLLRYLRYYEERRTGRLTTQLMHYDFSPVRAALIASVPARVSVQPENEHETSFGWPGLRQILSQIEIAEADQVPLVVSQVSSIASLGEEWISHFFKILDTYKLQNGSSDSSKESIQHIMFPTSNEIRCCLDGYRAGSSIHMRIQSQQAQRQLAFLRAKFVRWGGQDEAGRSQVLCKAGRQRAAPHIKTYVRYSNHDEMNQIDWAMLTSANLSTQAWGSLAKDSKVRISSYELGVLVWPSILANEGIEAKIVPAFGSDVPDTARNKGKLLIGFRMPYDLPLCRYRDTDSPWCATADYDEPDWKRVKWRPSRSR